MSDQLRAKFEAAVIERFKESGLLEVQIRVEVLPRAGDGYYDGSIDAYWHFFQRGAASVEVDLSGCYSEDHHDGSGVLNCTLTEEAIEAAGGTVKE